LSFGKSLRLDRFQFPAFNLKHFKADFVIIVLPEIPRFYAIDEKGAMIEKLFQFIFVIHAEYVSVNLGFYRKNDENLPVRWYQHHFINKTDEDDETR
jgi:hypothetical protein